jgi:outer membrane protein assembly factor BamB
LYALNPANGDSKWTFDTHIHVSSSPAISADGTMIYFGAGDKKLHALIASSGKELWNFPANDVVGVIDASPAIGDDGTIYFGSDDQTFYAVRPDGTERARFATSGRIYSSAAIAADGTVYFGSEDQKLYARNRDLSPKWERVTGGMILASPVLGADGTIYFASFDGNFYALRSEDGSIRWVTSINSTSQSTAAVRADGVIIVGADDRVLRAFNPDDGKILWSYTPPGGEIGDFIESSPIVAPDGAIYFGSLDGHLYKLNGNGSPLSTNSSWPAFRRDVRHTGRAVAPSTGGKLVNISTRALAGPGRNLIAGFVVQAADKKAFLVRAVGPGLGTTGVGGFMPDPQLEIFSGQVPLRRNDNWLENDESTGLSVSETAAAVQAFTLQPGSADAAILPTLPGGAFTVQVTGADGRSGVALVEVYDVPQPGDPTARLLRNLSTRGFVGTGENILIAGFVVGGTETMRLLIRGVGPGLAQFNVPGVLARPKLTIFSGSTSVGGNTGWTTDGYKGDLIGASKRVSAFDLQNGSADSAMLFDARPGPYTIQISGVDNTTGEALVEIYVLP